MKLRLLLLLMLFLGLGSSAYAQKMRLKGTVKDDTGEPLIGVAVYIKGTNQGVVTDINGAYNVGVSAGQTLVFSYVGSESQEHKIKADQKDLNVILKPNTQLDDVVVIGYGSARKVGTTIGSRTRVSAKDLTVTPTANALDALQGRVAGLSVSATSGAPGSAPVVLLHGLGTLTDVGGGTDSTPLYVVDGLPVDSELVGSLNADDFESVTVLKDASATSIYGARAAYGVIYITTKRGGYEKPTEVSINTQFGTSRVASDRFYRNLLSADEYLNYMQELGHSTEAQTKQLREQYSANTEWDKIYFRSNSTTKQTNVSVSGGGKSVSYYFSGSYFTQDGLRHGSGYDRYSLRTNIDARIADWISAGLSISLGHSISTSNGGDRGDGGGVLALPFYSAYDSEGNLKEYVETVTGSRFFLPQYTASKLLSTSANTNVVPNFSVTIRPIRNLTLKSQLGLQYSFGVGEGKELPTYIPNNGVGRVGRSTSEYLSQTITNTIEYKWRIGDDHSFTALVGQESLSNSSKSYNASSSGQVADELTTLSQGTNTIRVGDGTDVSTYNSLFSRFDYSFAGRYYADFSLRQDGSSSFGKNNRYATFWSAGLMWNAKHEKFLNKVSWLDELRLKVSTGTSGSRGGGGSYGSYSRLKFGQYDGATSYHLNTLGNPDLRWETQLKTTLGLNVGLFKFLRIEFDVYERIVKDMFFTEDLAAVTGFRIRPTNLAKLRSRGFDLSLSVTAYKDTKRGISVDPYFNVNFNDMRVLELAVGSQLIPGEPFGAGYEVGSPITIFAPIFKGVNPKNGDAQWYLPGEDRLKTTMDDSKLSTKYDVAALNQNTGKKTYAPWNGGFGLNASYKGLSLQVGFAFSLGRYMRNQDRVLVESNAPFAYNVSRDALDYWKQEGDIARNPRKGLQFVYSDSRLIEDASFLRLKNINLGYTLPKSVVSKIPLVKSVRFFATARNLLTFTKFTGPDPEFSVLLSSGGYPSTRDYTLGLDVKF